MAFEDLFVALRDDHFGKLRREEALQPPDPAQLLNLLGDPRFKAAVQLRHLLVALAQFAEQPRVLHRDHGLRGEILEQRDLLVGERPNFLAIDGDRADHLVFAQHRHNDKRAGTAELGQLNRVGILRGMRQWCARRLREPPAWFGSRRPWALRMRTKDLVGSCCRKRRRHIVERGLT